MPPGRGSLDPAAHLRLPRVSADKNSLDQTLVKSTALTPSPCPVAINPQLLLHTQLSSISLPYCDSLYNKPSLSVYLVWCNFFDTSQPQVSVLSGFGAHPATSWASRPAGKCSPGLCQRRSGPGQDRLRSLGAEAGLGLS